MNKIIIENAIDNLAFLPGQGQFVAVRDYVDGERSDVQSRDASGNLLWQLMGNRAELFGSIVNDVSVIVPSPAKPSIEVDGLLSVAILEGPISISITARGQQNGFASLSLKLYGKGIKNKEKKQQ